MPHLNIVHESIQGVQPIVGNDYVGSINLTKLQYLESKYQLLLLIMNIRIQLSLLQFFWTFSNYCKIQSIDIEEGVSISRFAVLNRPIFNFLVPLIMKVIKKNNDKLMSEDTYEV